MADENKSYFMIIAIVAIVAIVALVIMVSGKNKAAGTIAVGDGSDVSGQALAQNQPILSKSSGDYITSPSCYDKCDRYGFNTGIDCFLDLCYPGPGMETCMKSCEMYGDCVEASCRAVCRGESGYGCNMPNYVPPNS